MRRARVWWIVDYWPMGSEVFRTLQAAKRFLAYAPDGRIIRVVEAPPRAKGKKGKR